MRLSSDWDLHKQFITIVIEFGFSGGPFLSLRFISFSFLDWGLVDHLKDLLFLSLIRLVTNKGGLILFITFLLSAIFILTLVPFLALFFLLL